MNRTAHQTAENPLSSRAFFKPKFHSAVAALILLALASTAAQAQYPGGGGTGGSGSYPSYGSKGAVIGAVAGGAAAAAGLLYWKFHNQKKMQGCLAGSGDKLVSEKDNQTYSLTNKQSNMLQPGERVELFGKKGKDASGEPTFEVHKMSKDLGQCTTTTAQQMR